MNAGYEAKMILYFLLLGLQLQVLPSNARKSIRYCLTECHLRQSARLNTKVYRKISQRILLTYAITQILGNRMAHVHYYLAVDTRPSFFVFHPIRRVSVVANILREKFGPGDEASIIYQRFPWILELMQDNTHLASCTQLHR